MQRGFGLILLVLSISIISILAVILYINFMPSFSVSPSVVPDSIPKSVQTITPAKTIVPSKNDNQQIVIKGYVMQNNTGCTLGTGGECYITVNGEGGISTIIYCQDDASKTGLNVNIADQIEAKGYLVENKLNVCGNGILKKI